MTREEVVSFVELKINEAKHEMIAELVDNLKLNSVEEKRLLKIFFPEGNKNAT